MEENLIYKIEILHCIERAFNIEIKDEEVEYIETLDQLIELVKLKSL